MQGFHAYHKLFRSLIRLGEVLGLPQVLQGSSTIGHQPRVDEEIEQIQDSRRFQSSGSC